MAKTKSAKGCDTKTAKSKSKWTKNKRSAEEMARMKVFETPPPPSDDPEVNVSNALKWHLDWGWMKKKAYTAAGLTPSKFRAALADKLAGRTGIVFKGRKTRLSDKQAERVYNIVLERSLSLKATKKVGGRESVVEICLAEIQKDQHNQLVKPPTPSKKTIDVWLEQIGAHYAKADVKGKGRSPAFLNIRNGLSLAAAMRVMFSVVKPGLLLSTDDVSVMVHRTLMDEKPVVVTVEAAEEFLSEINVSTGTDDGTGNFKQRMLTFSLTVGGEGDNVCDVIKVCDRSFVEHADKPDVRDMGDGVYVILYHPSLDKEVLQQYMYECAIIPEALKLREKYINRLNGDLEPPKVLSREREPPPRTQAARRSSSSSSSSSSSVSSSAPSASAASLSAAEQSTSSSSSSSVEVLGAAVAASAGSGSASAPPSQQQAAAQTAPQSDPRDSHYLGLMSDGDIKTLSAITFEIARNKRKGFFIVHGKWGAGCSMTQSPNDVGRGVHPPLHASYKNADFKYDVDFPDPPGRKWEQLKELLHGLLSSGDFNTLWKAIASAVVTILPKCTIRSNIRSAFHNAGIVTREGLRAYQERKTTDPSSPLAILSKNPHFAKNLSTEDAERVLALVPVLAEEIKIDGCGIIPEGESYYTLLPAPAIPRFSQRALQIKHLCRYLQGKVGRFGSQHRQLPPDQEGQQGAERHGVAQAACGDFEF
jgi:hypothetical protein